MSKHLGYPQLKIKSKYELADWISDRSLPYSKAVELIKDVRKNHDRYWNDNTKMSEPEENKFVRSAKRATLGRLLKKIDQKLLLPNDSLVPDFIYGGISTRSHVKASRHLLGWQRGRTLLELDIRRFFEQIPEARVFYFLNKKCGCSVEVARLLAFICSVPEGAKGSKNKRRVLGRGFATSTRLAVWCNIDTFYGLKWEASRLLKNHDPGVAVFVDDIGVSASRVTQEKMNDVSTALEAILVGDINQKLPINLKKKQIVPFKDHPEHLGIGLGRNKLTESRKVRAKIDRIKHVLKSKDLSASERRRLINQKRSLYRYRQHVRNATKS